MPTQRRAHLRLLFEVVGRLQAGTSCTASTRGPRLPVAPAGLRCIGHWPATHRRCAHGSRPLLCWPPRPTRPRRPAALQGRLAVLRQLLGGAAWKQAPWLEPPFRANYGCNIHVGKFFYANTGCTILDEVRWAGGAGGGREGEGERSCWGTGPSRGRAVAGWASARRLAGCCRRARARLARRNPAPARPAACHPLPPLPQTRVDIGDRVLMGPNVQAGGIPGGWRSGGVGWAWPRAAGRWHASRQAPAPLGGARRPPLPCARARVTHQQL